MGCELCVPRETDPLWHIQLSLAYFPPVSMTVRTMRSHDTIVKLQRFDVCTCCCQSTLHSGFVHYIVSNVPMVVEKRQRGNSSI